MFDSLIAEVKALRADIAEKSKRLGALAEMHAVGIRAHFQLGEQMKAEFRQLWNRRP